MLYLTFLYVFPDLLAVVFGDSFLEFQSLVVPIGVAQLLAAPASALTILLIAQQRGSALLRVGTLNASLALGFTVSFGAVFGVVGAAWGGAISAPLASLVPIGGTPPELAGERGIRSGSRVELSDTRGRG